MGHISLRHSKRWYDLPKFNLRFGLDLTLPRERLVEAPFTVEGNALLCPKSSRCKASLLPKSVRVVYDNVGSDAARDWPGIFRRIDGD